MLQTTFYMNNNYQKIFVQKQMDAGFDLVTSSKFIQTCKREIWVMCQLDGVTQHVAHDQKYSCVAIGRLGNGPTTKDVIKIIVPGPTYNLQKNYKKERKRLQEKTK